MWTAENTYQMIKQILYNCEADCTVLIRKPQVISGGVRTPCTLPLDPPLYVPLYEKRSNKPSSWACTFIGEIEQNTKEEKMIQCSAPYWEIENTIRFRADSLNFFPLVSFCKGFYLQPPNACTTLRFFHLLHGALSRSRTKFSLPSQNLSQEYI